MWGIKSYCARDAYCYTYVGNKSISFTNRFAACNGNPNPFSYTHSYPHTDRNGTPHSHLYSDINS